MPDPVRAGIEAICGSPVLRASSQPGGFSPGVAARLTCADGTRWFVKAVSAEANSQTPDMHRREAEVLRALDPLIAAGRLHAPRLRGALDAGPWTALVLDDIEGRHPHLPWREGDLAEVLAAVDLLADVLTPCPIEAVGVEEKFGEEFMGWQRIAAGPGLGRIARWASDNIERLVRLERAWPAQAAGKTLVHADIRADNVLLATAIGSGEPSALADANRVVILDWPWACRGAAFIDLAFMAPSVAMQGGPPPAELMAMTRTGRAANEEAVAVTVCAIAGYFIEQSLLPPPPGIPTVREFQAAQGEIAIKWLAGLL